MYTGACLCGRVKYEIHGLIRNIVYCHCSQCRKAQGGAFASNGIVAREDFKFTQGEHSLSSYRHTADQAKLFCANCGSPIISKRDSCPDEVRVRLGTIESDISERPSAHIFAASKANWEDICGELPRYDSYEPGR